MRLVRKSLWVFATTDSKYWHVCIWDGIVPPTEGQKMDKRYKRFVDDERVLDVWFSQNVSLEALTKYVKDNKGVLFNEKAV